jgi:hypothetical protein
MKDGHYICTVIFGNNEIELYGYNQEITYAYIKDIDVTEMFNELKVWNYIEDAAYAEKPWA